MNNTGRCYNFSAGPAALPSAVLEQAQEELLNWHNYGSSIMEMSHRSAEFMSVAQRATQDLRDLLEIPANYKVLFLQGGAVQQFAAVPLNLLPESGSADYVNTGIWSKRAIAEAKNYGKVNVIASTEDDNFTFVPEFEDWQLSEDTAYVHYTPNETIGGLEFPWVPETGDTPLVADYSSTILSRPIDVSRYGVIYAGAQKNIGPAGLTVVIVRDDLLGNARKETPSVMNYQVQAEGDSMINTPPTFAWYLAGLVFQWLKKQGGLAAMAEVNQRKANKLYSFIDNNDFYSNPIKESDRSWMNIPFRLADESLDALFLEQSQSAGLLNLKGHRSVGGMRASIYNAVPEEAVDALINFMVDFANKQG